MRRRKRWPKKGETDPGAAEWGEVRKRQTGDKEKEKEGLLLQKVTRWLQGNGITRAGKEKERHVTVLERFVILCNEPHLYVLVWYCGEEQETQRITEDGRISLSDWQFINSTHTQAPLCSHIDFWKMKPCNFLYYSPPFESEMRSFIPTTSQWPLQHSAASWQDNFWTLLSSALSSAVDHIFPVNHSTTRVTRLSL